MQCMRLPSRTISGEPFLEPLPDGDYALICFRGTYSNENKFGFTLPNPFPWWIEIVRFSDCVCYDVCEGSNISEMLLRTTPKEVLIIEMSVGKRRELDDILSQRNIELVE